MTGDTFLGLDFCGELYDFLEAAAAEEVAGLLAPTFLTTGFPDFFLESLSFLIVVEISLFLPTFKVFLIVIFSAYESFLGVPVFFFSNLVSF